jgi:hypothetical protein
VGAVSLARRVALVIIAATGVVVGLWALAAPQSFYDDFPGAGRVWVAVDGPFNEHLVRDVGALNLALAFVAVSALVTGSVAVARAAGGAALIYGVPHLAYHATHLDPFDTADAVALVVSLSLSVAAAVVALAPGPDVRSAGRLAEVADGGGGG